MYRGTHSPRLRPRLIEQGGAMPQARFAPHPSAMNGAATPLTVLKQSLYGCCFQDELAVLASS
jgi:hypothetical protein